MNFLVTIALLAVAVAALPVRNIKVSIIANSLNYHVSRVS